MRLLILFAGFTTVFAQSSAEKDAVAVVQKLFDAMKAHDAAAMRALMLPDAQLLSVRDQAAPRTMTAEAFVTGISAAKGELVERFTAAPKVWVRGRMAQVWGEYEFLRDGKFSHCGVDTATLFQTPDGWKLAALAYTAETTGCKQ